MGGGGGGVQPTLWVNVKELWLGPEDVFRPQPSTWTQETGVSDRFEHEV